MLLLLINSSTPKVQVILTNDHKIIGQQSWPNNYDVGKKIIQACEELLIQNDLSLKNIGRFAVCSTGSQRFSWLRAGVLVATLLAYANQAELVSLPGGQTDDLISQALSASPVEAIKLAYRNGQSY